jgi:hypothetical protein
MLDNEEDSHLPIKVLFEVLFYVCCLHKASVGTKPYEISRPVWADYKECRLLYVSVLGRCGLLCYSIKLRTAAGASAHYVLQHS